MPRITYVNPNCSRQTFDVTEGLSVMQGAVTHGVSGILGECGGNAMCATCHVYIDPPQAEMLPSMSADEEALLDGAASERKPNSRLSCQLTVTAALDGLVVELPERQI
jgi:ferredoxin, 2Fe-2S